MEVNKDEKRARILAVYKAAVNVQPDEGGREKIGLVYGKIWGRLSVLCVAAAIHIHGSKIQTPNRGRDSTERHLSAGSETAGLAKRPRKRNDTVKPNVRLDRQKPSTSTAAATASEIVKRHLIVALIDRSNLLTQITQEKWKAVELKLLNALFVRLDLDPGMTMWTFDHAGSLNEVKKCKDEPSLL